MPITTADFASKKTYQKALLATLKASAKGPFYFYDTKYDDGNKAKLLVFGPNVGDLKKHFEARKATLLDEGQIGPGAVFAGKRGKLDAKAFEALGIADLARSWADDEKDKVDANTIVPGLELPVRKVLADVIAYGKEAATLQHPKMKTDAEALADALVDRLKKGRLAGFKTAMESLQQMIADAKKAPKILEELERIEPVANAHKDPKAKPLYESAKKFFDAGDMVGARGLAQQFSARYGHQPYVERADGADRTTAAAAAKVGTLAGAYEAEKVQVEGRVAKVLGDPQRWPDKVAEAKILKDFFGQTATLGLRKQIEAIESEADKAKKTALVEKAIVATQAYLEAGTRALEARKIDPALSLEYFRLLRHLHLELKKLHH